MKYTAVLLTTAFALSLSACSSTATKTGDSANVSSTQAKAAPVNPSSTEMAKIIKALASDSIYFDYNKFTVKPEYMAQLKQNYEILKQHPGLAVRVEGNADERGSAEYNLALGQKRAEAVKHALLMLGVPEAQLEAVSYGSEKPRAACHDESCWSQNRRVDFTAKKPS